MRLYECAKNIYCAKINLWKPKYKDKPYGDRMLIAESLLDLDILFTPESKDLEVIYMTTGTNCTIDIVLKTDMEIENIQYKFEAARDYIRNMDKSLKPCPYCGSPLDYVYKTNEKIKFRIYHTVIFDSTRKCPAFKLRQWYDTLEEAIDAWNSRVNEYDTTTGKDNANE